MGTFRIVDKIKEMEESQIVEYKLLWKDEYLKWICGFANAFGGTIFIGKDDKAVLYIKEFGRITNGNYQKINHVSHRTAARDFAEMVQKEIILGSGTKGAGSFYVLK